MAKRTISDGAGWTFAFDDLGSLDGLINPVPLKPPIMLPKITLTDANGNKVTVDNLLSLGGVYGVK